MVRRTVSQVYGYLVHRPKSRDNLNCIDVYYIHKQDFRPDSSSPNPRKPEWVVKEWLDRKLPVQVIEPVAETRDQIALAHHPRYVDGILSCELIKGIRGRQKEVAQSLPWICGSFLSAARGALENGLVACSLTSGFYHAGFKTFDYCIFNRFEYPLQYPLRSFLQSD